ncbi:MAG: TrkH family potassium uptake protein [Candidatus Nanohaloarchaea archaeon]
MRTEVVLETLGRFLQLYSVLTFLPTAVAFYYSEPFLNYSGFIAASLLSLILGTVLRFLGSDQRIQVSEALFSTVLGWLMASMIGSIPLLVELGLVNALFEASSGLTTTGISMVLNPGALPKSLLFWRSFMQWIGGLGILTFFIAVIRESGGATRRLYSAEAHKADPGSIRPSLQRSVVDLWKVYGFLTSLIIAVYIGLGMPVFDSLIHAFSGISTGGFSTSASSIGAFSNAIQAATIPFMVIGGVNFVLLYRLFRSDVKALVKNSEFRLYIGIFVLLGLAASIAYPGALTDSLLKGFFQAAALVSSTGYSNAGLAALPLALQSLIIGVMFVGGSIGSTSGGVKVFRVKVMYELLKSRLRSFRLPESAVNEVTIDHEILGDKQVKMVSVIFFSWVALVFCSTLAVQFFDGVSLRAAVSGTVSAVGNMGPMFMSGEQLVSLSPGSKLVWIVGMVAGRLEMVPLLAIFNMELFEN